MPNRKSSRSGSKSRRGRSNVNRQEIGQRGGRATASRRGRENDQEVGQRSGRK